MRPETTFLRFASIAALLVAAGAWWAGCNEHPTEYSTTTGGTNYTKEIAGGATPMDLLWVIDNSGSMCEEQATLREEFDGFINQLNKSPVDFNIAVTTTQIGDYFSEAVASGGEIQSVPHPPTGFGPRCTQPEKIRNQVQAAIRCTKNPENFSDLENPSDDQIACATDADQSACDRAGPGWDENSSISDLFPCGDADGDGEACSSRADFDAVYRDIPKVLEADSYEREDGSLNVDKLQRDFACMSYVGTRGDSFEQGLRAAVEAVNPAKTGGPAGDGDDSAPNHGFIRKDAQTGVIFVTDENDCSHPDDAELSNDDFYENCGEMSCYALSAKDDPSPLYKTEELAKKFRQNLAESKGVDQVDENDIVMASLHGSYLKYGNAPDQVVPDPQTGCTTQETAQPDLREAAEVCNTSLGTAKSGDRYEDFLREFEHIFPPRPDDGGHLKGWMCDESPGDGLEQLGTFLQPGSRSCIRREVVPCEANADCPDYRWGQSRDDQICHQWGTNPDRNFCQSATQVRLSVKSGLDQPLQRLRDSGICYNDSIGAGEMTRGCVVKRKAYSWVGCQGSKTEFIDLEWNDDHVANPVRELSSFDIEIRYTEVKRDGDNYTAGGQSSTQ